MQTNPLIWLLKYFIAPFFISNAVFWTVVGLAMLWEGKDDSIVLVWSVVALLLNVCAGAAYGWLTGGQMLKKIKPFELKNNITLVQSAERTRQAVALYQAIFFACCQLGGCTVAIAVAVVNQL